MISYSDSFAHPVSYGTGNAKLAKHIATFSLPAGFTCPGALHCLAFANRETGNLKDGAQQHFRCFSASAENRLPDVRNARWRNIDALKAAKTRKGMAELLLAAIPRKVTAVRIHVSGDFFSLDYLLAWCDVAAARQDLRFYAYTKSIHFWQSAKEAIPANLVLTASLGGKYDARTAGLKTAQVVFSEEQAEAMGLQVDHDDRLASHGADSFALMIHGPQRAGSEASKAKQALAKAGWTGYSAK